MKDEDYVPSDGDEQVSTRASRSRMGRGRVKQEDITEVIVNDTVFCVHA